MSSIAHEELKLVEQDINSCLPGELVDEVTRFNIWNIRPDEPLEQSYVRLGSMVRRYAELGALPEPDAAPVTAYARAVMHFLNDPERPSVHLAQAMTGFCLEAEMHLQHSLRDAVLAKPTSNRAAIILTDEADKPLGFYKHRGLGTLYTWSSASIPTAEGTVRLPAASFSFVRFADSALYEPRQRLHKVVAAPETIDSVTFGRFDMSHFSTMTRAILARSVTLRSDTRPHLAAYARDAWTYHADDVAQTIRTLSAQAVA